jgi:hypothetical protein
MSNQTWFEDLTGFPEQSPSQVRSNLDLDGSYMTSAVNGRTMTWGDLETPSLAELRTRTSDLSTTRSPSTLSLREVVGDVQDLHSDRSNAGALFQVASQFNLLEMASPSRTPEDGVGLYERDHTQGPACAIAAGAGTIYRNYFVEVNGQSGQTRHRQINCFSDIESQLHAENAETWPYRNGYVLPSREQLEEANRILDSMTEAEIDRVRTALRVGIQSGTEVTLPGATHLVTQVYASALPVAYSSHPKVLWSRPARLVLEAAYEATLHAAYLNATETGNRSAYLTLLGGGAFGNDPSWIFGALRYALETCASFPLDIAIVSFNRSDDRVQATVQEWQNRTANQ